MRKSIVYYLTSHECASFPERFYSHRRKYLPIEKKSRLLPTHCLLFSCVTLRTYLPGRYLDSLLRPGTLTAPGRFYLMLLRSRPDMVHRFPSRKTRTSTPLIKGSSANIRPPCNFTPTIADCGYKVPLTPRLHGPLFYIIISVLSMPALFVFLLFFAFFLFSKFFKKQFEHLTALFFQNSFFYLHLMVKLRHLKEI